MTDHTNERIDSAYTKSLWTIVLSLILLSLAGFFLGKALSTARGAVPLEPTATTADFNRDGVVDAADMRLYDTAFEKGDTSADFDGDGFLTGEDYDAFVVAWEAAEGWTDLVLPEGSFEVRVSTPPELLSALSKLDGTPGKILLRAGGTFPSLGKLRNSGKPGAPLVIGRYGDGPNPVIECFGNTGGVDISGGGGSPASFYVRFEGLDFTSARTAGQNADGITFIRGGELTIEGCRFFRFSNNLNIQGPLAGGLRTVVVRRCVIADAHAYGQHSQGIYAENIEALTLVDNLFDHNGHLDDAPATIFNHNTYLSSGVHNVLIEGNISARASATGLSANYEATVENNLVVKCPVSMFFRPGATIRGNVIEGGGNIGDAPRGIGIWTLSERAAGTTAPFVITDNVITSKDAGVGPEPAIRVSTQDDATAQTVTIAGNVAYRWPAGGVGAISIEPPAKGVKDLFVLAANQDSAELAANPAWPAPGRTTADYMRHLGLTPTAEAFLDAARANTRQSWDRRFTAAALNAWVKAGYGK